MITYKKVKKILVSELTILDYIILTSVANGIEQEFLEDETFRGHFSLLKAKDYISLNNKMTIKGKDYLEMIDRTDPSIHAGQFFDDLNRKLEVKMIQLTGKKQKMLQGKYAFMCNSKDLRLRLERVIKKYSLDDMQKVEKVLLSYIERCHKAKFEMVSTIPYYILKGDFSKFATDYENYEESLLEEEDNRSNIVDI